MLQGWRCHRCHAAGELECLSNHTCDYCWQQIVRMHAEASPDCGSSKDLAVSDWEQKIRI